MAQVSRACATSGNSAKQRACGCNGPDGCNGHEMRTQRSRARKSLQSRLLEWGTEQMRHCPVQQAACTSRRLQVGWHSDGRNSGSRVGQSRSARSGQHVANVRAGCSSVAVLLVGWDRMLQRWDLPEIVGLGAQVKVFPRLFRALALHYGHLHAAPCEHPFGFPTEGRQTRAASPGRACLKRACV